MLTYDEFKQAIDDGYITGGTVMIVRKNGQIFDYVLPNGGDKRLGGCDRGEGERGDVGIRQIKKRPRPEVGE
ncbi:paratox [Streptococcus dysgalactiae]|nr:paratox [Streptococcus dysgalactiae]